MSKSGPGPEAFGTVDEAVAALGTARALATDSVAVAILARQRELFVVAAELATAPANRHKLEDGASRVTAEMVGVLESEIDVIVAEAGLPREFVVPGGSTLAAAIDVARTVVRRAERLSVALNEARELEDSMAIHYLNRLADYLYVLARAVESEWTPSRTDQV